MGKDEFIGIIVEVGWRSEDAAINQNLIEIVYIHGHNLGRLLDE